jgi:hypothetical protein
MQGGEASTGQVIPPTSAVQFAGAEFEDNDAHSLFETVRLILFNGRRLF